MINAPSWLTELKISDYDYTLPESKIAKYPLPERDQSKLLLYRNGQITTHTFNQLDQFVPKESILVFNNTRVIPARLNFNKSTGARIELFCLEPVEPAEYQLAFQSNRCTWKCIVGNLKKWKESELNKELQYNGKTILLTAKKTADHQSYQFIEFTWNHPGLTFSEIIELAGVTPIPPYLNRNSELIDRERYQTIYSKVKGSVAAPTAGLHFTESILQKFQNVRVKTAEVTLHVGAGTFKPVQSESISEHEMHTEFFSVSRGSINQLFENNGNIIAVGTTTLRTLESLYWLAVKIKLGLTGSETVIHLSQWDAYQLEGSITYPEAMIILLNYMEKRRLVELFATTQILIAPGYKIRSVKALITNFHQPRSTLLLLVSAITGADWKKIYDYALENDYRFLSYGDSSLLFLD